MPFVTPSSSKKIDWDITTDKYDPLTGKLVSEGNGLEPLVLSSIDFYPFDALDPTHEEFIWRGQPDPAKKNWLPPIMPVFRILTNRFKGGERNDIKSDWGRFWREWLQEQRGLGSPTIFYEPHIEDIRIDEDKNRHFPFWVIEELYNAKAFEFAMNIDKVNLPGSKRLTKQEYERIMKEIETRSGIEGKKINDNVSRSTKQSAPATR